MRQKQNSSPILPFVACKSFSRQLEVLKWLTISVQYFLMTYQDFAFWMSIILAWICSSKYRMIYIFTESTSLNLLQIYIAFQAKSTAFQTDAAKPTKSQIVAEPNSSALGTQLFNYRIPLYSFHQTEGLTNISPMIKIYKCCLNQADKDSRKKHISPSFLHAESSIIWILKHYIIDEKQEINKRSTKLYREGILSFLTFIRVEECLLNQIRIPWKQEFDQ